MVLLLVKPSSSPTSIISSLATSISTRKVFLKVLLYLYLCNDILTFLSKLLSGDLTIIGFQPYDNDCPCKIQFKAQDAVFRVWMVKSLYLISILIRRFMKNNKTCNNIVLCIVNL